ncbi:MAG: hypothetical protein CMD56_09095 [Gammaproteobacteria bacterium]|nr:hypothetical protein [Gammaproteobacteria bacterium]
MRQDQHRKMKRFLRWKIKMGVGVFNSIRSSGRASTLADFIKWRVNLSIKLHNWLYDDEPIQLIA